MRLSLPALLIVFLAIFPIASAAQAEAVKLREAWETPYAGGDAEGKHVVALWKFDAKDATAQDAAGKDASGNGHDLTFVGAKPVGDGRFGGCLESARGLPIEDKPHQARANDHNELSPQGPFTIEMWIMPKKELDKDYPMSFLLDKRYVSHNDYQLILGSEEANGQRCLSMILGFGKDWETYYSRPLPLQVGKWLHLAFVYDGNGKGCFFINGLPWGEKTAAGRKNICPGGYPLMIGDRLGSNYHGFPGFIDEVRICKRAQEFRRAKVALLSERTSFLRMESAALRFAVTNLQQEPINKATLTITPTGPLADTAAGESADTAGKTIELGNLAAGKAMEIEYAFDTRLRPADYTLLARLQIAGHKTVEAEERIKLSIVPRPLPDQFTVLMWGVAGGIVKEMDRLKRIGFNHALGLSADDGKIWKAGKPTDAGSEAYVAQNKAMLNEALRHGMTVAAGLSPVSDKRGDERFLRVASDGKPRSQKDYGGNQDVCPLFPELKRFSHDVGASMTRTYGDFPAFGAALAHTEVRGAATPCFHEHDRQAFKKATGLDIPAEIQGPRGVNYKNIKNFPADRAIADDNPIYLYYRWYWKEGDGWNPVNSELTRGLKSMDRDDLWVFHDPAVRVASVYGSGGEVDVISQWTYSYPDPIRIGIATDELLAMAAGAKLPGAGKKQQVMKMTQIIWYRSQTAPEAKKPQDRLSFRAGWEVEQPDAPFITIAPMHLREAFWTKIARPIRGIMYHGWQSLLPCDSGGGYRYTNEHTQEELTRLIHEIVQPLGPTLLHVPGVKSDVAILESLAAQMFAGSGTYGWCGGWPGDAHLVAQYAHLQPEIVYDETIVGRGLDGYRILIMPDCDVITKTMAATIKKFQADGGIVVGDENTAPAVKPDIVLKRYSRVGRADKDKAALLSLAAELRGRLDGKYTRRLDSSNPDVIPYRRAFKGTDYVFVVNDNREYGQYVGHHGLVMENGLPSRATLSLRGPNSCVYDLVEHRQVAATKSKDGVASFDVELGPCDGRLFMVTARPVAAVRIAAPESAKRGEKIRCELTVEDDAGRPLEAVLPLEVTIRDSSGSKVEFSGYWAAVDGRAAVDLDIAPNDPFGAWQIEVRELASGKTARRNFRVEGPSVWPPGGSKPNKEGSNPVQPKG